MNYEINRNHRLKIGDQRTKTDREQAVGLRTRPDQDQKVRKLGPDHDHEKFEGLG